MYFLSALRDGLFFKYFSFNEGFSKTGKLRTLFENHPAALKSEANKKDVLKAALIFFASFFGSSQKMKFGLFAKLMSPQETRLSPSIKF